MSLTSVKEMKCQTEITLTVIRLFFGGKRKLPDNMEVLMLLSPINCIDWKLE